MNNNLIGTVLMEQFRVDSFLASGGMGAVYQIWDLHRNTFLAMKVLHLDPIEDPSAFKYFKREARALQKLAHPNIVPFYGLYHTDEITFLLEYFVDGPNLKDILRQNKNQPLPIENILIYMKALCSALGYAHANNVIHCDVKPGNVMVDSHGNIYLADFGIARHAESTTTTLNTAGTPSYMAPEQIKGEQVTPATDIYALAVLLYEMVTGRRPFLGDSSTAQQNGSTNMERIRFEQLKSLPADPRKFNPTITDELTKVIFKGLQKFPSDRFENTQLFFNALCEACKTSPENISSRIKIEYQPVTQARISEAKLIVSQNSPGGRGWIWGVSAVALLLGLVLIGGIFLPAKTASTSQNQPTNTASLSLQANSPTKMISTNTPKPKPTIVPSLTPTLAASPTNEINCPDKNRVELFVRASGRVKVNQTVMLERPAAAGETDYKRIRYLIEKERILILDGPICFNGNTWWKFKTESSDSGWSPELDSGGKRLLILDSP